MSADIALVGLAVMGQNLILNMNDHGFTVVAFNRTVEKVDDFLAREAKGTKVIGAHSLKEMVSLLKKPRRVILLVKAGDAVDSFIEQLLPLLEKGDIIIDGGNSEYTDTNRRAKRLTPLGIEYVGSGVSGGELGARHGPSMMPGGSANAWPHLKPIFQSIAAKALDGAPCCEWIGPEGAGHFVKMVHNGIEYGDMQLIAEAYSLMKSLLHMKHDEMADVFAEWNKTELESYLIEITSQILRFRDPLHPDDFLVDKILDAAGQKGTGKWTVQSSAEYGVPVTLIAEALFARCLSAQKQQRVAASEILQPPPAPNRQLDKQRTLDDIRKALYASKLVSYAQGFQLMRAGADNFGWKLNYGSIAMIWRAGCIIRSKFLYNIKEAFDRKADLQSLLVDEYFAKQLNESQMSWRRVVGYAVEQGVAVPAFSSALSYFDGYRSRWLPANMLQAQRDFFGAHQYERVDTAAGVWHHTNWTGEGGSVASSTYTA